MGTLTTLLRRVAEIEAKVLKLTRANDDLNGRVSALSDLVTSLGENIGDLRAKKPE